MTHKDEIRDFLADVGSAIDAISDDRRLGPALGFGSQATVWAAVAVVGIDRVTEALYTIRDMLANIYDEMPTP